MKRRDLLIATATALFVLQAPLCALACLPAAAPEAQVAETHHDSPCHEQAPSSNSSEPAGSHDDCGCESSYPAVVLASPDQTSSTVHHLVVHPPHLLAAPLEAVASRTTEVRLSETDLPPPDILLLKSTLLI